MSAGLQNDLWHRLAYAIFYQSETNDAATIERAKNLSRKAWNCWAISRLEGKERNKALRLSNIKESDVEGIFDWKGIIQEVLVEHEYMEILSSDKIVFNGWQNNYINLDGYIFPLEVEFNETWASRSANFNGSAFFKRAKLSNSLFSGRIFFQGCFFNDDLLFEDNKCRNAYFSRSIFEKKASFAGSEFERATFRSSTFQGRAVFNGTTYKFGVDFNGVRFKSGLAMRRADIGTIKHTDDYKDNLFKYRANFINTKFGGTTEFDHSRFRNFPPEFFGAEMHEGTTWNGVSWPLPRTPDHVFRFVRAYERLKLEMNNLQNHDARLNFLSLELRAKRAAHPGLSAKNAISFIYEASSDYGRSVSRPLLGLAVTASFGILPYMIANIVTGVRDRTYGFYEILEESFTLSITSTFGSPGLRREFFTSEAMANLHWSIKALSGTQTLLGLIFIFLVGLGLRNRFRIN